MTVKLSAHDHCDLLSIMRWSIKHRGRHSLTRLFMQSIPFHLVDSVLQ
jgi:hypothetical protein